MERFQGLIGIAIILASALRYLNIGPKLTGGRWAPALPSK